GRRFVCVPTKNVESHRRGELLGAEWDPLALWARPTVSRGGGFFVCRQKNSNPTREANCWVLSGIPSRCGQGPQSPGAAVFLSAEKKNRIPQERRMVGWWGGSPQAV